MKKQLTIALLYTVITTILLGLGYPLAVTAIAHIAMPKQAAGTLIYNANGELIGSHWIGQSFTGPTYFHSRPSAAGAGYDPTASSGSNLGSTSAALITRIQQSVTTETNTQTGEAVPIDLVAASGSGLDPEISPAAALYQVPRIAAQRKLDATQVHDLVMAHIQQRQLGILGEARVNVLELNLALDQWKK